MKGFNSYKAINIKKKASRIKIKNMTNEAEFDKQD